jgi:hypothetical protein
VAEVGGVDEGRGERVGRVDPDVAVAERPLERDLDLDGVRARARTCRREQELDLARGRTEEGRAVLGVDGVVAVEDGVVVGGDKGGCRCGDVGHDLVAELGGIGDELRSVGVGDGGVDIGQELGRLRAWIGGVSVDLSCGLPVDPVGDAARLRQASVSGCARELMREPDGPDGLASVGQHLEG